MDEPVEMTFGLRTRVPGNPVLDGVHIPLGTG